MSKQITTLTFFRYSGLKNKIWAFQMMQFAHTYLQDVAGLSFYKLMGSGKGLGFNPLPDWSVYCLLQTWDSEAYAKNFWTHSTLSKKYRAHTTELCTLYLRNITAAGLWSGSNPFQESNSLDPSDPCIAVITRATIKWSKLYQFWKYVPTSHRSLRANEGLLYTKGIGEVPIVQMATFSLWRDLAAVKKFAYESKEHQVAIQKTRKLNWYREELFARFQAYKSVGQWEGRNPLIQTAPN